MAVTVEELQIVLQCDATQAQAALNSLNTAVDKAVKKISSIESASGKSSPIERTSEKIEEANKKLNGAFSSNKMGGLRDFFRGIKEGWNEARKEREAALEPPPKQSTHGVKAADAIGYNQPSFAAPNVGDTHGMKAADAIARLKAAQENVSKDNDGAAQSIKKTGDAAEQATPKVERYANATRKTGKSFSFFSRLSKAAHGIFDKFGKSIRKHEGFFEKFGKTLKRVVMRMLAMGLVRGVINGMRQGLQLLAKSSDTAAQQFGRFTALGKAVKAALGSAALAVLNAFASVLYSIASAAVTAANAVAQFFAVIGGTGKYIGVSLSGNFDDLKDSIDGAGGAAKGLLADFDELNIIGSKGGGGGGGLAGIGGITSGEQDAHSPLADLLLNNQFAEAGAYVSGKLGEILGKIDEWFLKLDGKHYGAKFADFINGIFSNESTFVDAGKTVSDGFNTIIHFIDDFLTGTNWITVGQRFGQSVMSFVTNLDWGSMGHAFGQGVNALFGMIYGFFSKFDGRKAAQSVLTALNNAIKTTDWKLIATSLGEALLDSLDFATEFMLDFDWLGLLNGIMDTIIVSVEHILSNPVRILQIINKFVHGLVNALGSILIFSLRGIFGLIDKIIFLFNPNWEPLEGKVTREWQSFMNDWNNTSDDFLGKLETAWDNTFNTIGDDTDKVTGKVDELSNALSRVPKNLESTIKINTVVTSSGSVSGGAGGGKPNVNITLMKMAQGGIAYGSTLANIGEYPTARSNPEVVAPLSNLRKILESGKGGVNSADVRKQNELLQEQNRLLRVIAQKELRISPSPELGQVVTKSQALFGNV